MTKYVGIKEFRQNVEKYTRHVKQGGEIIVMKHNKPLFRMCSPDKPVHMTTEEYLSVLEKTRGAWAW
jgi:antitoxin (DNA-binding transcriptional repressor) of toxin-antitoxin stability system